MSTQKNIPTLEECLNLWQQREAITADIERMEQERVGLQATVKFLRESEHSMRVRTAQLCYDLSKIFEIAGKLTDNEKTDMWPRLQDAVNQS